MNIMSFPCHNDNTYIWRIGELEYLFESGLDDKIHDNDDSLWVRSVPELITDNDLSEIFKEESKYSNVYNSYKNFYEWDAKDAAFNKWRKEGLTVPDYCIMNDKNDLLSFVEKYDNFIIRVNNQYGGKCSKYVSKTINKNEINISRLYKRTLKQIEKAKEDRKHTRIILVEFLNDSNGEHRYIRSYVCNNKVVLSNDYGACSNGGTGISYKVEDFNRFLERNRELEFLSPVIEKDIVRSVSCFDLNFAAVDWMLIDGKCYLLEINPYWGMGYEHVAGGFPFFPKWKELVKENYLDVPENIKIRIETNLFWDKIYKESFPDLFEVEELK